MYPALRALGDRLYDLQGVAVEHHEASIAGVRTHWVTSGPESGPPVLLVHGAGGAAALWYATLPALVAAGHRVVVPDVPGHGESDAPRWRAGEVVGEVVNWLESFAAGTVENPIYIGHSYGGYLGLLSWLRRPGRYRAMVLVAAAGFIPGRSRWLRLWSAPVIGEIVLGRARSNRKLIERMVRGMAPRADEIPAGQAALDFGVAMGARDGVARFRLALVRGTNTATGKQEWSTAHRVGEVTCPVLVVQGPHDFLPAGYARRAAAAMPAATYVEIPGTGHLPHMEAAPEFNRALVDWLATLKK